jgi:cytochrome P450
MTYVAGADTTVSSIVSFFLAMLVYPDVQAKAQAEIDRVAVNVCHIRKTCRLCHMSMQWSPNTSGGYLSSLWVKSVSTHPQTPLTRYPLLGSPHMATADDEYKRYFIPKGTTVLGSVWYTLLPSTFYYIIILTYDPVGRSFIILTSIPILRYSVLNDISPPRLREDTYSIRWLPILG